MDLLKKELAPLSTKVWQEIEKRAQEVLVSRLSARKAVHVVGPMGWDYTSVSEGRLDIVEDSGDVKTGVYRSSPLTEARVRFTLNRWEMDNLNRGARDIDLASLDAAAEKIAEFEERAIYSGFKAGGIIGLKEASAHKPVAFGANASQIMEAISNAVLLLQKESASKPYSLIVGQKAYLAISKEVNGIPLVERIERMIGGSVIPSLTLEGAFLIPYDDENLELVIGQDFAIGYESHDTQEVTLFITESFLFRVLDPHLAVPFTV
ncbi:MAG: family 1 encapsulin nanocompartment shell protein [Sphaerochaetaceae bacterium]|nr:family 1 encapsulin nanocompartment shell protein [Sphaerochaetaceae bacterium]MDC7247369.1 family 1 encapsulin nanocompartment shell protein [Sphaerochaetaceae bacterium]